MGYVAPPPPRPGLTRRQQLEAQITWQLRYRGQLRVLTLAVGLAASVAVPLLIVVTIVHILTGR
ncbi:hypothetical protein [Deinococcus rufus]|uniref:Uncharacterized protein n=1 Tax=Deinococcus rufus TaxID=2136097 RepID=A0ABV7Z8U3_9DEIO